MFKTWLLKVKKTIHISFEASIILKGINGLFELVGGILLLCISTERIIKFLQFLTYGELVEDPRDHIANYFLDVAHNLSLDSKAFISIFLISHGIIKLFLIIALFKKKKWAYPTAIIVFAIFALYQIYRFILYKSTSMLLLLILDFVVIVLTWLEYKEIRITSKDEVVNSKS